MANIRINCKNDAHKMLLKTSCDTFLKLPVHLEQFTSIENKVLYTYRKFESFLMVLYMLLIVNVWQKVLTCALKAGFDAQNF